MKKKALITSILTIALCLSLIAGSTFALFTSESTVNIAVTSGTVKVTAAIDGIDLYTPTAITTDGTITDETNAAADGRFGNGGTAALEGNLLTLTNMVPGDSVTVTVKITNESNVDIQYRTILRSAGEDNSLLEALNVTLNEIESSATARTPAASAGTFTGNALKSEWTAWEGTSNEKTVEVTIELPGNVGNDYQNKACTLAFTVEAVQANADMPAEWNGEEPEVPTLDEEDGMYHITTAAQFIEYINAVGAPNPYHSTVRFDNAKVVLDNDIDLGGYTIVRTGETYAFAGQFDGQNHKVSNFTIKRTDSENYTGLFGQLSASENSEACVKNLRVDNATVIGAAQTAVVVAGVYDGAKVENCHVSNSIIIGEKKVGSVVSYSEYSTVNDCTATNCAVYCSDNRANQAGAVLGYNNSGTTNITDESATNVTVTTGVAPVLVSTAAELRTALTSTRQNQDLGTIILLNDITVPADWTAIDATYTSFVLDGFGHSISGLPAALISKIGGPNSNVTVKNLTFKNVNIYDESSAPVGAFVNEVQAEGGNNNLTIDNCHVEGGSIYGYKYAGGFVGFASSGTNTTLEIKNSSVKNVAISTTDSSCGGFIGHTYAQTALTNCTVEGNTSVACAEDRDGGVAKAGWLIGTINCNTATITGCTVSAPAANLTNNNAAAPAADGLVGRNVLGTISLPR